ncbi:hypothetical protein [Leptotrichia massiliensis]|uniref:hypothetical protein n=1 Tax=Leptotrichia massiliensis TaxID=1852388 RepID=UPI0028D31E90|nr:hypothetical protein [Leptotrichia massiliensis]
MFSGKNEEKLSVELLDMAVDTSEVINIKNSKVVYINGAGKLKEVYKEVEDLKNSYLAQIRLNDIPLIQINTDYYISTIEYLLATGYGIENVNCKEILEIQEKINSDFISLEDSIETITPLLKLLNNGFYMVADVECYPTDGNGNFFWNVPNDLVLNPAIAMKCLRDDDFTYIGRQPVYLYPTQTTDAYNSERVDYYIEKFKKMSDNEPRVIVYNCGEFINFMIDGHHKACAAALLGKPLKCILIKKAGYFMESEKGKWVDKLYFFSLYEKVTSKNVPKKYLPFKKNEMKIEKLNEIKLEDGRVNKRKWENKYLDSVENYPSLEKYANIVNASINFEFKITDELIKKYVNIFDENSQEMMKKIIYILMYTESLEKLQKIVIKYAKNSLNYKIDKDLKLMIYNILFQMKNNSEVEQIFIDYIVYNEDKDDPVLELINSYWK